MDNVAVAVDNHARAVILDMGVCELPFQDKSHDLRMLSVCDSRYSSPETKRVSRKIWTDQALLNLTHGYQGPASDVWAAGLTAVEMFLAGVNSCRARNKSCIVATFDYATRLKFGAPKSKRGGRRTGLEALVKGKITQEDVEVLLTAVRDHWDAGIGATTGHAWRAGAPDGLHVDAFCALLGSMLSVQRGRRPTMRQAADHEFWQRSELGVFGSVVGGAGGAVSGGDGRLPVVPAVSGGSSSSSSSSSSDWYGTTTVDDVSSGEGRWVTEKQREAIRHLAQAVEVIIAASAPTTTTAATAATAKADRSLVQNLLLAFPKHATPPNGSNGSNGPNGPNGEIRMERALRSLLAEAGVLERFPMLSAEATSALWALMDTDDSGAVSKQELFVALVLLLAPSDDASLRLELLFVAADENGDGSLSQGGSLSAGLVAWGPHSETYTPPPHTSSHCKMSSLCF